MSTKIGRMPSSVTNLLDDLVPIWHLPSVFSLLMLVFLTLVFLIPTVKVKILKNKLWRLVLTSGKRVIVGWLSVE